MTNEQTDRWRKALAKHRRRQRQQRGRRRSDPYAEAQPVVLKRPVKSDSTDGPKTA